MAMEEARMKAQLMQRAEDILEDNFSKRAIKISLAVNKMHNLYLKNNAFVTKTLLDLKEMDADYKVLVGRAVEIIQDWETLAETTTSASGKYNAEMQKQELKTQGTKVVGLVWNVLKTADMIIKKQSEALILTMSESDYLKQILEEISINGLKNSMIEIYKDNIRTATPEVKEWIRGLATPLPRYDLDIERAEEELPEPEPITVHPKTKMEKAKTIKVKVQYDSDFEMKIFQAIKENLLKNPNDACSLADIREHILRENVSVSKMWRTLNKLVNRGLLISHGEKRGRYYTLGESA